MCCCVRCFLLHCNFACNCRRNSRAFFSLDQIFILLAVCCRLIVWFVSNWLNCGSVYLEVCCVDDDFFPTPSSSCSICFCTLLFNIFIGPSLSSERAKKRILLVILLKWYAENVGVCMLLCVDETGGMLYVKTSYGRNQIGNCEAKSAPKKSNSENLKSEILDAVFSRRFYWFFALCLLCTHPVHKKEKKASHRMSEELPCRNWLKMTTTTTTTNANSTTKSDYKRWLMMIWAKRANSNSKFTYLL